jgi:phage terminase large subunit-like protein
MLCIAGKDMRRFVLDDRTRRGEFTEILDVLRDMIVFWRPDKLLVEAKAAGPSLMSSLEQEIAEGKLRAHDLDAEGKDSECHGRVVCVETETSKLWRCNKCGAETNGSPLVCAIEGIEVDIDKERRVDAILPQIEARLVYILEGAVWNGEFVEEHALFPESPMNDRVDALSQVLEAYKDGPFYVL